MNIKLLKFIVIFFGILIVFGLLILLVGIYHKFNNFKKKNNSNTITLKLAKGSKLEDFYISNDNIIIKYELDDIHIINIYDLISGKNIKKIITAIENTIIDTLKNYNIKCFADRKNIGIWFEHKSGNIDKIAAIGIKVKKWIAYHGFALNISNDLNVYKKIVPCGIRDRGISNLNKIKKQNYKNIENDLIKNFLSNIKN